MEQKNETFQWDDAKVSQFIKESFDRNSLNFLPLAIQQFKQFNQLKQAAAAPPNDSYFQAIEYFKQSKRQEEKPILFTTHDGVGIRENETYYWVRLFDWMIIASSTDVRYAKYEFHNQCFSTEAAAKEWVFWNKPVLHLEDINQLCGDSSAIDCKTLIDKLKIIIQTRRAKP